MLMSHSGGTPEAKDITLEHDIAIVLRRLLNEAEGVKSESGSLEDTMYTQGGMCAPKTEHATVKLSWTGVPGYIIREYRFNVIPLIK